MSIGGGIALIVIGAILAFAVDVPLGGFINLSLVGWILMAAGIIVLIIGIVLLTRRRQSISTTRTAVDPASGERVTRHVSDRDDPIV